MEISPLANYNTLGTDQEETLSAVGTSICVRESEEETLSALMDTSTNNAEEQYTAVDNNTCNTSSDSEDERLCDITDIMNETDRESHSDYDDNNDDVAETADSSSDEESEGENHSSDQLPMHVSLAVGASLESPESTLKHCRFVCSVHKLLELIGTNCHTKGCDKKCHITYTYCGSCMVMKGMCGDGHAFTWTSSDTLANKAGCNLFTDNLDIASAVLLSGNNFAKISLFFQFLNIPIVSKTTFHSYQRHYICTGIDKFYQTEHVKLLEKYQGKGVVLAGDGRCDSPGSSAKFCSYSLLDIDSNKILHVENVDKREVSLQSPNMEREAVSRAIGYLKGKNITIEEIVTDASSAVRKMLHVKHSNIHHSMDIWHKAKKLRKALNEAGKTKNMEKLVQWSGNIVNHFWYSCRTCDNDLNKFKDKWFGILHHVLNEHQWLTGTQGCDHGELQGPPRNTQGAEIQYFSRSEPAFRALRKLLTDKRWLKSMKYYTKFRHTGVLESFHSHLLGYCSKRIAFQNQAYISRIQLAILDHNHHSNRETKKKLNGEVMYQRKYRKQTKRWDVTPTLVSKEYSYIPKLMDVISRERANSDVNLKHKQLEPLHHPCNIQKTIGHRPPENTAELVASKLSRFSSS